MLDLSQLENDIKLFALFDYGHVFSSQDVSEETIVKLHAKVVDLIDKSKLITFRLPTQEKVVSFLMDMGHFTRFKTKLFNIGTLEQMYNGFTTLSIVDFTGKTDAEICEYILNDGVFDDFVTYICGG